MPKKGYRQTKEHRGKISFAFKARGISPKTKLQKGHKWSKSIEIKRINALSKSLKGKHISPKTEFKKGHMFNRGKRNPHFGKKAYNSKPVFYKEIKMRSSWEVNFAKWCDKNNIKWLYEPKRFDLGDTTYTPDFYLPEPNIYVEIKGWWRNEAKKRFDLFKEKYPNKSIRLLMKLDLVKLGISLIRSKNI